MFFGFIEEWNKATVLFRTETSIKNYSISICLNVLDWYEQRNLITTDLWSKFNWDKLWSTFVFCDCVVIFHDDYIVQFLFVCFFNKQMLIFPSLVGDNGAQRHFF